MLRYVLWSWATWGVVGWFFFFFFFGGVCHGHHCFVLLHVYRPVFSSSDSKAAFCSTHTIITTKISNRTKWQEPCWAQWLTCCTGRTRPGRAAGVVRLLVKTGLRTFLVFFFFFNVLTFILPKKTAHLDPTVNVIVVQWNRHTDKISIYSGLF